MSPTTHQDLLALRNLSILTYTAFLAIRGIVRWHGKRYTRRK